MTKYPETRNFDNPESQKLYKETKELFRKMGVLGKIKFDY